MELKIHCEPSGNDIFTDRDRTLLEAMREQLPILNADCSGKGTCGKCVIRILEGKASEITKSECDRLGDEKISQGFRLACQVKAESDITVYIPCLESGIDSTKNNFIIGEDFVPETETAKYYISRQKKGRNILPLTLDYVRSVTGIKDLGFSYSAINKMCCAAETGGENGLTLTVNENAVISAEPEDTSDKCLGVAFDIGTTTVFGALCDLNTGKVICTETAANSQAKFGADVVSRIEYCCQNENGSATMQKLIVSDLNKLINILLGKTGNKNQFIYRVTAVGNTTMCNLLLGISPVGLSRSPFVPLFTDEVRLNAEELTLETNPDAAVYVLPGIASFIGSDTTAVADVSGITNIPGITVAVDIGTNSEILAAKDGVVYACSAAAGPAFEGACIRCGMRASNGVISFVELSDDAYIKTIGDTEPIGICGSGLIKLTAQMLKCGIITRSGVILSKEEALEKSVAPKIAERLFAENGENAFLLYCNPNGEKVALYQKDVREMQLAKSAIMAGTKTLLKKLNVGEEDIDRVLLFGTFGSVIDAESAEMIGLIPNDTAKKSSSVGNGAGTGAIMALLSSSCRKRMSLVAKNISHVDLSKSNEFYSLFTGEMVFKHS